MSFCAALGFYFLTLTSIADQQWRLLLPSGDVEIRWGPQDWQQSMPAELKAAWYWSSEVPPVRLEPADLSGFRPRASAERRLLRRFSPALDPKAPPAVLLHGPEALWLEVSEDLLPRLAWPVNQRELRFPTLLKERWRVRYLGTPNGASLGSFWHDFAPGQKSISLPLAPAVDRVLDVVAADGGSLSQVGMFVTAPAGRGGRFLAKIRGVENRLTIPILPDSDEANLLVQARGGAPAIVRGFPSTWPRRLVLAAGANLRGRFFDDAERPIPGIEVIAEAQLGSGITGYTSRRARTDAQGIFLFENLAAGKTLLRAVPSKHGAWRNEIELLPGEHDLGVLRLGPVSSLEVLLRATTGENIPDGIITPTGGEPVEGDKNGVALLKDIDPEQTLEIAIEAPFFIPRHGIRFFPPHPPRVELRLEKAFYLRGSFLDRNQTPMLPGRAIAQVGNLTADFALEEGGRFDMLIPIGQAGELVLTSRQGPQLRLPFDAGQEGEIRDLGPLYPAASRAVVGALFSAVDGLPVAGARIWLPRPGATHPLVAFSRGDVIETTSREDGSFELVGLLAGTSLLRIDAPGFARREIEPTLPGLPEGENEEEPFDLGRIELTAGARLVVEAPGARPGILARLDLRAQWQDQDFLQATVNEEVAVFPQVPPGSALLTIYEGKRLLCEKSIEVPEAGELEVECRAKPPRLRGVVMLGGRPAPGGELHFLSSASDNPQIIQTAATPGGLDRSRILGGGRPQVDVVVLPDGSFKTEEVLAGKWQVAFSLEGGFSGQARPVEVPEGEEATLRLEYSALAIAGIVVDTEKRPVEGAWVREGIKGAVTRSEADGRFVLFGAEAGPAALQAEKHGQRSPSVEIEVGPEGYEGEVTLVLGAEDQAGRLQVQVFQDGIPAGGALVFLEGEGGKQELVTADSQGRARVDLPAPRPPRVRWGASLDGRLVFGEWTTFEQAQKQPGELELALGGELVLQGTKRSMPQVLSESGWDVAWWLGRLGMRPIVRQGSPAVLTGLPPGLYRIKTSLGELVATVEAGESTAIELPD